MIGMVNKCRGTHRKSKRAISKEVHYAALYLNEAKAEIDADIVAPVKDIYGVKDNLFRISIPVNGIFTQN